MPNNKAIARVGLVILAVLLVFAGIGTSYEQLGRWRDQRRFPQQGRSVQAGNIRLNINCTGQGKPVVVLDAGGGVPGVSWSLVQPEVAKFTRVCSYDRAGYGWSDPGPEPRTSDRLASELHALLQSAGEQPPFILVGHSFGAWNMRLFKQRYPDEAAGAVLVDPSDVAEDERIDAVVPKEVKQAESASNDRWSSRLNHVWRPLRIPLGVRRFEMATGWGLDDPSDRRIPSDLRQEIFYLQHQEKAQEAFDAESASFDVSAMQVRAAAGFGNRPLIMLTAGEPFASDSLVPADVATRKRNAWIELHAAQARLSTRGKQVIIANSSHVVPYDRPDAVIAAIREIWTTLH